MEPKKQRGHFKRTDKDNTTVPSAERYTKPGDKRKTYIVNIELADKMDEIAYVDRTTLKSVVNDAFTNHVDKWEKENGPLKIPEKK